MSSTRHACHRFCHTGCGTCDYPHPTQHKPTLPHAVDTHTHSVLTALQPHSQHLQTQGSVSCNPSALQNYTSDGRDAGSHWGLWQCGFPCLVSQTGLPRTQAGRTQNKSGVRLESRALNKLLRTGGRLSRHTPGQGCERLQGGAACVGCCPQC